MLLRQLRLGDVIDDFELTTGSKLRGNKYSYPPAKG